MIDLASTDLDPAAAENQAFLDHLQGGILASHGRDHVLLLLFRFVAAPEACRGWLGALAAARVTSARRQLDEAARFRERRELGGLFTSIFLTSRGYVALGCPDEEIAVRFPEALEPVPVRWQDGMEDAEVELNDPPASSWDCAYRGRRIHLMVLLAEDDPGRVREAGEEIVRAAAEAGVAELLGQEAGAVFRDEQGRSIEPFGYLDGRSQPLFLRHHIDEERRASGGTFHWDPQAPLGLAVLPDPLATKEDACGSYLVFRKLEQKVEEFRRRREEIARRDVPHGDPWLVGAMAVGRFEDGTPVFASGMPAGAPDNNFDFASVAEGRCPLHAHIRKVNPRGQTSEGLEGERTHRIVRRSIPYLDRSDPSAPRQGLLFLCFQSSLARQFAFLQQRWLNDPTFPHGDTGTDPLAGQPPGGFDSRQRWPDRWDSPDFSRLSFQGFVELRGGEFFFAPSLPFLLSLSTAADPAGSVRTPGRAPRSGRGRPPA